MGGAAHGFVRPPPRFAAETTTMAASAGGPACSPPRLRARRQARDAARDDYEDEDEDEDNCVQRATKALPAGDTRATRCASGWRPATQSSMIAGQRAYRR